MAEDFVSQCECQKENEAVLIGVRKGIHLDIQEIESGFKEENGIMERKLELSEEN